MDYKKHYELLISSRKDRKIIKGEYYETHHIVPKSMGGSNDVNNLIKLTAKEHFIAHWLLWRIYKNKEMAFAFHLLVHNNKNHTITSSRVYEECKLARRPFIIENNQKYHKGKELSKEQKEKISEIFKNLKRTKTHCDKISKSLTGKPKSDSHRKNLSESLKNYDWADYTDRNHKISVSNSGKNNGRSKLIHMKNLDGEIIMVFETMKDALNYVNTEMGVEISKTTFWRKCKKENRIENFYFLFV